MTEQSEKRAPALDTGTKLAVDRTRLAHDRTLMAWVRTATSLISFGFTIFKFFQVERAGLPHQGYFGPTEFSLLMISIGLLALLMATVEHRRSLSMLDAQYGRDEQAPRSLAIMLAGLISILGIVALVSVLFRL